MGMEIQVDNIEDMCSLMCDNTIPKRRKRMTNKDAINYIDEYKPVIINEDHDIALRKAVIALELLDCLTDRPCSVCRHRKENGCSKWDCVFDGHIGGRK